MSKLFEDLREKLQQHRALPLNPGKQNATNHSHAIYTTHKLNKVKGVSHCHLLMAVDH